MKTADKSRAALKALLWLYIALCLVIAGLNYGAAPRASQNTARLIARLWHFYENEFKTVLIATAGWLTFRIISGEKNTAHRKQNLIGFFASAVAVHILLPFITKNPETYFFVMPPPWTTTPLQLLDASSSFAQSRLPLWGLYGVSSALMVYVFASAVVFGGTLLLGRRWQCSTLCLFNGFVSEAFSHATPLVGKSSQPAAPLVLRILQAFRRLLFGASILFFAWWTVRLLGFSMPGSAALISRIELVKYLGLELMMAMFFWVAFLGRGYCYICPLGTALSFLSKAAGQKIETDKSRCIGCGMCTKVCPMSIDVMTFAKSGKAVTGNRCVGCGHCVDACPTGTLVYTTKFLTRIRKHMDR